MTPPRDASRRLLRHALRTLCLGLLLAGAPAAADDDDDSSSPPGSTGDGSGAAASVPAGAPSTGSVMGDLRGLLGSLVPGAAAPPPPAPRPAPAAAPAPAPRPAAPAAQQPATTVPNQITIIGLDAVPRARLLAAGFSVIEEVPAGIVPGTISRLGVPRGVTAAAARDLARGLAPAARVDLTHLYRPGGEAAPRPAGDAVVPVAVAAPGCMAQPVGVVDTAVDPAHPALAGRAIEQVTRRSPGRAAAGTAHGTAVTALLAAAVGPAPIVVVDAFHRRPDGDAADAFDIAASLALLAARGIQVVNLSFAGPANEVLALATERAAAQGMLLAAAAGNDGPRSPPRYPAAYPWVVAVTAVDAERRPFIRAVRGSHLSFAARGVGLPAPGREGAVLSGTSYAVPFVTAAFARAMVSEDRDAALLRLARDAEDLGPPGRDTVFGWGLLRAETGCAAPAMPVRDAAAQPSMR